MLNNQFRNKILQTKKVISF